MVICYSGNRKLLYVQAVWKTMIFSCTVTYDSSFLFLRIDPKEMKAHIHTKTYTLMFTATLMYKSLCGGR